MVTWVAWFGRTLTQPSSADWCRSSTFLFASRSRHPIFDCDWSSDVCSSDLEQVAAALGARSTTPLIPQRALAGDGPWILARDAVRVARQLGARCARVGERWRPQLGVKKIGRASCRERA